MTVYPEPTAAERRAWYFKKQDDRRRAAYRNSLPKGFAKLYALLAEAPSPWHAEVIQARIDQVREQNRYKNRRRRAAAAHGTRAQAEADHDRRISHA